MPKKVAPEDFPETSRTHISEPILEMEVGEVILFDREEYNNKKQIRECCRYHGNRHGRKFSTRVSRLAGMYVKRLA